MDTILITHNDDLSNENLYELLIQGVRDQFLNPSHRIILRLNDEIDMNGHARQIILLQKVYHNIEFEDLKRFRKKLGREIDSISYHSDPPFDQAMYRNMLDEIIDPATRHNLLVFVEQNVMDQITEIGGREKNYRDRHVRRPRRPVKRSGTDRKSESIRREIERFRKKKVRYTDISEHPKAKIVSQLYDLPINKVRFDHLRYYFTRTEFQYNPFDRINPIPLKIGEFDYVGALQDLSSYHKSGSYYSKLLTDSKVSSIKPSELKRIDQLDLSSEIKDFIALSYVKYRPQAYIITVWGPGFSHLQTLIDKLSKDGLVYYVKELELNRNTLEGVMFWLYNEFSYEKRADFIRKKLDYINASDSNKIGVIVFDNVNDLPIAGQGSRYKTDIRKMVLDLIKSDKNYNGEEYRGNDLIHVNDYHYQTVEYSQIYFHSNTLKYIGAQDRSLYLRKSNERSNLILQTLRSYMYQNGDYRDFDRIITFGSTVLYALGIRRNADIDAAIVDVTDSYADKEFLNGLEHFFMNPKSKIRFADIGVPGSSYWRDRWTERNVEWFDSIIDGPTDLVDFATNPAHHFYFQGIKVCLIEHDVVKKILRGEAHDMLDLVFIRNILQDSSVADFDPYYSIMSANEISNLKPFDNPLTFQPKMKKILGHHGKSWATLGKAEDLDRLSELINRTLKKRYDTEQIDMVKDTPPFKHLVKNHK